MEKMMYRSFSSTAYLDGGSFTLTGADTIKMDIISHLYTDTNERIMMPGWGSIIPRVPFEPMTGELVDKIYDDVTRIVSYDPRVRLNSVIITPSPDAHIILVEVEFTILETNGDDSLFLVLDMGTDG